jgi:copper chaperone CopZ
LFSSRSAGAIVKSVKALDSGAQVRVNMETHSVEIESGWARLGELSEAIGKAGFTPVSVHPVPQKITFAGEVDVPLPLD